MSSKTEAVKPLTDAAAIRKQFKDASHTLSCATSSGKCNCWKATFGPLLEAILSQLAEALKDTGRLDWVDSLGDIGSISIDLDLLDTGRIMHWNKFLTTTARMAIDAARAQEE